jgi:hypothetical protein
MATYPNEQHPADSAVRELNGMTDQATGLAYIARGTNANGTPPYEVQYNRRLRRQNQILAALRQGMVVDEGALAIGVYPISYTLAGVRKSFDGATGVAIPDDCEHKVYLDANNLLQVAASFPANVATYLPLATVVTAAGQTTIVDERVLTLFAVS